MLRLAEDRVEQALALAGHRLDVGSGLEVGPGRVRTLMPYATVYSHFVSTGAGDEAAFLGEAAAQLRTAGRPGTDDPAGRTPLPRPRANCAASACCCTA